MADSEIAAPVAKWRGGVTNVPMACPVEAVWELCSDWVHWQRWWPGEPVSELREGENRLPGCLRFGEPAPGVWLNERLLEIDNDSFFLKYRMEDNVFLGGLKGYVASVQFRRTGEGNTIVEHWTYEMEPHAAMSEEAVSEFLASFLTESVIKGLERGAQLLAQGLDPKPPKSDDPAAVPGAA